MNKVRELLGHKDIKMVLRYAHLAPNDLVSAVETIARGAAASKETGIEHRLAA